VHTEESLSANPSVAKRPPPLADDLLRGAAEIAEFVLGDEADRKLIYRWAGLRGQAKPPIFRIGSILCARRSQLIAWIAGEEAAAASSEDRWYPNDKPRSTAVARHRRNRVAR
jgi:hypothetical protein